MANKDNSDAELPSDPSSSSLSKETIQEQSSHRNDPQSNPDPDTTVKSENRSEPEETQEEETGKQSRHGNDPQPNPDPDTTVKSENGSEPEEKQKGSGSVQQRTSSGLPQDSRPKNVPEIESVGSSGDSSLDNEDKKEDESLLNIQRLEEAKPRNINETDDKLNRTDEEDVERIENEDQDRDMNLDEEPEQAPEEPQNKQPQITVPGNNSPSDDSSPENAPQENDGSVQQRTSSGLPQDSRPKNVPEIESVGSSGDSSLDNEDKKEDESPLNIQRLEEAKPRNINETGDTFNRTDEEDVERIENEDQDQDMNLDEEPEQAPEEPQDKQPQITVPGNNKPLWTCLFVAGVILLPVVCAVLYLHISDSTPPVPNELNVVDVFNQEMKKLETSFPNQRKELWRRSLIHLRRHLKTEHPTEPVSLILTSGHRAEKTLSCLARCLARAFSTALNSSVLNINGKSKASQDSDQVKMDIDRELRKAFEGKKSAAVIHRFEELPPGSTLIFYRYCDHENAAYKDVFLAFTVMLDAEVEVPSSVSLGRVEEMVQEHIKQKFVSSDKSAMFNQMDVDKLSGLWSRISHLILPVAAEEKIEQQGCGDCDE